MDRILINAVFLIWSITENGSFSTALCDLEELQPSADCIANQSAPLKNKKAPRSYSTNTFHPEANPLKTLVRWSSGLITANLQITGTTLTWAHLSCRWVEGHAALSPGCNRCLPPLGLLSSVGASKANGKDPSTCWTARSEWSPSHWKARCSRHPWKKQKQHLQKGTEGLSVTSGQILIQNLRTLAYIQVTTLVNQSRHRYVTSLWFGFRSGQDRRTREDCFSFQLV